MSAHNLKMALGQDAVEQLSQELMGGYSLNTRLLSLLRDNKPLDSRGQEAAVAMIQELCGVFGKLMASLHMIKSGHGGGSGAEATMREGRSVVQRAPAKDKPISGEELTRQRNVRGEVVTRKITASSFEDVYQWKKYGKKEIQNREFARVYYRCHSCGCRAKKQVQQRDSSSSSDPIMYQVTYVNEHTCLQVPPTRPGAPPTLTPTDKNKSGHSDHPQPQHRVVDGNAELESKTITWTLPTILAGAPSPSFLPPPPILESSQLRGDLPPTYMPDGAQLPSQVDMSMDESPVFRGSPLPPVEAAPADPWWPSSVLPPPVQGSPSDSAWYECWTLPDQMAIEEIFQPFSRVAPQPICQH